MKNFFKTKFVFPLLAIILFLGIAPMAHAYFVIYYTDKNDCTVSLGGGVTLEGTKVTFAGGGVGCLVNKTVYNVRPVSTNPDGGNGGDAGGVTKVERIVNYFSNTYPSFISTAAIN